ncbi:coiled-coil domain-containing protein 94 [Phytophthora infestans T30-4]|uniref:Splicing factor YJU2 n=1 Tax=Phytophthora infestans (strain T30-4) TaxID=403677 RepID=D0NWA0_PHYIT|nr:coiled-coil domain-containing protein 94 [Phytophthora infestans T30-4]EEY66917.1 coiled-coil domain-containing protein 94 [Phytophthora infestans T30-4]|eukprot:XP_002896635.1 coiled-coil domain-containing protein 94 [Phytophthora infestans T30-4]
MGERKVLNKYFPPDFDPSLIPRRKKPKNEQVEVRMMLPFSIQCATCGEYMYRGKKFNSRKEEVLEENYHGIRIYRFYIKCITCSSEITFKTDPKRGDYVAEHGCQRNFEPWRENEDEEAAAVAQRVEEEKGDAMKALENRTLDSKREMDILDALDEIKAINQRHAKVDTDKLLQQHADVGKLSKEEQAKQLEEDRQEAHRVFEERQQKQNMLKRPVIETPLKLAVTIKKKATVVAKKKRAKPKTPVKPVASLVADYSDSD